MLHERIVHPTTLAVHADLDTRRLESAGEGVTDELGTLVVSEQQTDGNSGIVVAVHAFERLPDRLRRLMTGAILGGVDPQAFTGENDPWWQSPSLDRAGSSSSPWRPFPTSRSGPSG